MDIPLLSATQAADNSIYCELVSVLVESRIDVFLTERLRVLRFATFSLYYFSITVTDCYNIPHTSEYMCDKSCTGVADAQMLAGYGMTYITA